MNVYRRCAWAGLGVAALAGAAAAQPRQPADRSAVEAEALRHFQALVRMDTTSPPGNEKPAADYVAQVLEREGIPVQTFALEAHRPNVVARLAGNGRKRPLLIMGHTDTVNVDPSKWQHPPFSAARDGGHVYGRGTVDDKDSVTAGLMTMLLLKRNFVPLDRDVIFLAEAGEEIAEDGPRVDAEIAPVGQESALNQVTLGAELRSGVRERPARGQRPGIEERRRHPRGPRGDPFRIGHQDDRGRAQQGEVLLAEQGRADHRVPGRSSRMCRPRQPEPERGQQEAHREHVLDAGEPRPGGRARRGVGPGPVGERA